MSTQVIVCLDNSASMKENHNGATRLQVAKELATSIIDTACKEDADGPEVIIFGQNVKNLGSVDVAKAQAALAGLTGNEYATMTGAALREAFKSAVKHQAAGDVTLIVVVTDGEASDKDVVRNAIISHTKQMTDDGQCAVEFVAVGSAAKAYLESLDDNLTGAAYDIVDATMIEEAQTLGVEALFNKAFND